MIAYILRMVTKSPNCFYLLLSKRKGELLMNTLKAFLKFVPVAILAALMMSKMDALIAAPIATICEPKMGQKSLTQGRKKYKI